MRAKKAKKPSRAIQYLLSADRKLRKLSLKKMSGPATKTRRPRRPNPPRTSSSRVRTEHQPATQTIDVRRPARMQPALSSRAVAFIAVGVVAAATLVIAWPRSNARDLASVDARLVAAPTLTVATTPNDGARAPATASITEKKDDATSVANSTLRVGGSTPTAPAKRPVAVVTSVVETKPLAATAAATKTPQPKVLKASFVVPANKVADPDSAKPASVVPNTEVDAATDESVTVTGCLEDHNGAFRLKDASGVDAPKVRGWRTGFLRKRPAPIELVDPANKFKLAGYVGQRVAATGVLSDREMRPRSLHRVATSCR